MNVKRFTASYISADSNFEIRNITEAKKRDKFYSLYCLLYNLLQRGCPTKPSEFLSKNICEDLYERKLHLFSKEVPEWGNVIKGHDKTNSFPARTFYYNIVPKMLPEYPFLQQIMIPEMPISDFIFDENEKFKKQKVDFFISEANLVIEIDGSQHSETNQQKLDKIRDEYLRNNGYTVIRIPSKDIHDDRKIKSHVNKIKNRLEQNKSLFDEYRHDYEACINGSIPEETLKAIATMRFQITILELCISGKLSLNDKEWKIAIRNKEVTGYEKPAVNDILLWLDNLCILAGLDHEMPTVYIQQTTQLDGVSPEYIKVDFSVLSRKILEDFNSDRVIVSNGWRQDIDYFQMITAKPIKYIIDDTGIDGEKITEGIGVNEKRIALRFILKSLYGYDDFRPGQERIIINALKRRDTIGVLPTGSGKSLCYQIAALLQPCVSFCICPIKSLMIDQDQNLKGIGVDRTAYISSDLSAEDREKTQKNFAQKRYWWVFMSPERLQSETFREYLLDMNRKQNVHFGYAVIDEVHCLSEWGHSFRVSYLNLVKTIRNFCPNISLIGLTATASFNVLKNILVEFGMFDKKDVISIPSFTRPELNFKVVKCGKNKYTEIKRIIDGYMRIYPDLLQGKGKKTRCGIVFTPFANGKYGCFDLANKLSKDYLADVRCFAGERPKKWPDEENWDEYKRTVQDQFKEDDFSLLCATKAFGMGIDKPNVRYTVHYGIPSSLESLYQEAGRAGRDKRKAECVVLYTAEEQLKEPIAKLLGEETKPSEIKAFGEEKSNWYNGNDAFRQLFLLSNESSDIEEETRLLDSIVARYAKPDQIRFISADYTMDLASLQKYIYHLSLIGVVRDWTVDWRSNTLKVYFSNYTVESVFEETEKYIKNYDSEYKIREDELFISEGELSEGEAIHHAAQIFLTWYGKNILYTRRKALFNVMVACDKFDIEGSEKFKEAMEAYFRLDDVSDILGEIADQPREVKEWFKVLNVERIRKNKVSNIIMNLNRFLESYQNNVGLNFVSGILNLIDHHFDSPDGRIRLLSALKAIKAFSVEDKLYVLEQSSDLIAELSKEDDILKEEYSEFFIRNYEFEDTDKVIYKKLYDNYSLITFLRRMMVQMIKDSGGK